MCKMHYVINLVAFRARVTPLMNLSNTRLKYLYETAQLGTMRSASEKLNVATSSISRQIAELEKELGLPLFEKGRRRLKLTEAGELACRYYREKQSQQEAFLSQIKDLQSMSTGNICIAVGEAYISESFSDTLQIFMQQFPGITVRVKVSNTNAVVDLVREDEAHLGLIFDVTRDPNIRSKLALPQPIKVIVHKDHPLAGKQLVRLKELVHHNIGLPEGAYRIRQIVERAEHDSGLYIEPHLTTNSLALLEGFAKSGQGVLILPELVVHKQLGSGELVAIPTDNEVLNSTQMSLITRLARQLPTGAYKLMLHMENYFKSLSIPEPR